MRLQIDDAVVRKQPGIVAAGGGETNGQVPPRQRTASAAGAAPTPSSQIQQEIEKELADS